MKSKMRAVSGSLLGAVAIHVAFAACSDSSGGAGGPSDGMDAQADAGGGGLVDALVDAFKGLMDAREAEAGPTGTTYAQVEVFEEPCTTAHTYTGSGGGSITTYYAVHAFPGLLETDLVKRVTVVTRAAINSSDPGNLPGYVSERGSHADTGSKTLTKDGSVAIECGSASGGHNADTAYFRLLK
jgi:hypothetical protein